MFNGHIGVNEDATLLGEIELERHVAAPNVKKIPIKQGRVRGMLYMPPGPGPHPAVVDIYGGAGGLVDMRAGKISNYRF